MCNNALPLATLQVISDLADPSEGVYSSAAAMEERLEYTDRMLERHQRLPIIPEPGTGRANAETNAYLNRRPAGVAVTKEDIDGREVSASAALPSQQRVRELATPYCVIMSASCSREASHTFWPFPVPAGQGPRLADRPAAKAVSATGAQAAEAAAAARFVRI